MTARGRPTVLSAHDREAIEWCIALAEDWAFETAPGKRIRNRGELAVDLFDIGARLRAILIWVDKPARAPEAELAETP